MKYLARCLSIALVLSCASCALADTCTSKFGSNAERVPGPADECQCKVGFIPEKGKCVTKQHACVDRNVSTERDQFVYLIFQTNKCPDGLHIHYCIWQDGKRVGSVRSDVEAKLGTKRLRLGTGILDVPNRSLYSFAWLTAGNPCDEKASARISIPK
jgi:hypothetical protein